MGRALGETHLPEVKIAQKAFDETPIIRLVVEDQRAIAASILRPRPLTPAMERAIERYRSIISTSR
jgi:hypothetical protein